MCVWPRAILQYLLGGMVHQFSFLTAFMLSIIISGGVALKCLNGSPMHQYYTTMSRERPSVSRSAFNRALDCTRARMKGR